MMDKGAFEHYAESLMKNHHTPGAIVALNHGRYEKGFGYRDQENEKPVTGDTVFGIGSITKCMTCIAILQLQENKQLSVHDSIQTHLPELTFDGAEAITVHHLMTHTSGIPPLDTLFYANKTSMQADGSFQQQIALGTNLDENRPSIHTYEELIQYLNHKPFRLLDKPGESFSYSNDGYALLGIIIERVSGECYEPYLKENLFQPLGMNDSFIDPKKLDKHATKLYVADPTTEELSIHHSPGWWDAPAMWAAGYVKSTANDMLRFGDLFLSKGSNVITPESLQALTRQYVEIEPGRYYGYGLVITPDFFGTTLIEHTGGIKGVSASFAVLADKELAAVCLTNIAGAPAEPLLKGAIQSEIGVEPDSRVIQYADIALNEGDRKAMVGTYSAEEGQNVIIYEKDTKLYVDLNGSEFPTRSVGRRALTISMHGNENLLQFKDKRLHFGFRQLRKEA